MNLQRQKQNDIFRLKNEENQKSESAQNFTGSYRTGL